MFIKSQKNLLRLGNSATSLCLSRGCLSYSIVRFSQLCLLAHTCCDSSRFFSCSLFWLAFDWFSHSFGLAFLFLYSFWLLPTTRISNSIINQRTVFLLTLPIMETSCEFFSSNHPEHRSNFETDPQLWQAWQ